MSILQLKLGDIIQLYSSSSKELDTEMFIISYIDSDKLVLNHPERTDPIVLLIDDDGKFIGVSIEQIALLNRSENDGYLAQNNLNVGELLELLFVDESGAIDKVYGQISEIDEDMMTLSLYPSKDKIYIDFAYKGIPLELNLRAINVIESFPDIVVPTPDEQSMPPTMPTPDQPTPDQPMPTPDQQPMPTPDQQPMPPTQTPTPPDDDNDRIEEDDGTELKKRQLFIDIDKFFLGDDIGEIDQEVELGEKERRYGIDAQLNDLLEELLAVVPDDERNQRVLGNINNLIQKFRQLRDKYSDFDDYDNANKKPKDDLIDAPLVKAMTNFNSNVKWLIPVIKNKNHVHNAYELGEFSQHVENTTDFSLLWSLSEFLKNYYKGNGNAEQNKYDHYLRYMNRFFESHTPIEGLEQSNIINTTSLSDVKDNLNVVLDNLGDLYSEVAKGNRENAFLTTARFVSTTLVGESERTQLYKSKMGEMVMNTVPISDGDELQLASILALPQKIVSQNDVHLNTKIIDKTKGSTDSDYFNYFRRSTSVVNRYVEFENGEANTDLKQDIARHVTGSIKNINNIMQIEPSYQFITTLYNSPDKERQKLYTDFLMQFMPSNKEIINEIALSKSSGVKMITTIYDFVKEMSTFMMSKNDFTHADMVEAQKIISRNISTIKQRIINRGDELSSLVESEVTRKGGVVPDSIKNAIYLLLNNVPLVDNYENEADSKDGESSSLVIINIIRSSLENYYGIKGNARSSSETIKLIYDYDSGKFLNMCLSYLSLVLHSKLDLNSELNALDQLIQAEAEQSSNSNECSEVIVAKKYDSLEALNTDNGSLVYYDSNYDETRYDILEIYKDQQVTMAPPQFKEFLKNKLMENVGLNDNRAMKEADAMINGKRLVEEGDVAILEIPGDNPRYYTREKNEWKRNTSINYDVQTGTLQCETKQGCYNIKNKCVNKELAHQLIKATNIQSMVNIFDVKQEKTRKQIQKTLNRAIQLVYLNKSNLDSFRDLKRKEMNLVKKQIANQELLKGSPETKVVKSPYSKLFQAILGQEDFVQQQHNIIKFVNQFTYDSKESHWYLCIKTSQNLIPKFLFKLAQAFISGDYFMVREQICASQGVLSDDGDKWVDKHSGYVIKMVDATGEEGYDGQGYKLQVREVLETNMDTIIQERQKEINSVIAGQESNQEGVLKFKDSDFTQPYSDIVIKIVNALGRSIGLELHQEKPFIVTNVLRLNSVNFSTKEDYDKKAATVKKQKNIELPSFDVALNLNILLLTCCFIILSIQLAKPTMNTKKNVPGCFKHFKGFPYEANGDNAAVVYIACAVGKIKNTKTFPWKSLGKTQVSGLVKKLMAKFEKQILKDKVILQAIDEKREWVQLHPEEEESDEIMTDVNATLEKWETFKPSLDVGYSVKAISPLSEEFKRDMLAEIKKGSKKHGDAVNTVSGKLIEQSTFYKNKVNDIVSGSDMILKTAYQNPYMQNCFGTATLDDKNITQFLNTKNQMLQLLTNGIERNERILDDLRVIMKSPTMNPHFNTRKLITTEMGDFTEETIYKYFIKQCKFGDTSTLGPLLTRICGSKPPGFDGTSSFKDQVAFLKSNGHQYSKDSLNELLKATGNKNAIGKEKLIELYDETYFVFRDFLGFFTQINTKTPLSKYLFDDELNQSIERLFSLNLPANGYIDERLYNQLSKDTGALREVKNNLSYSIELNRQNVTEFLQSRQSTSRKQKKQLEDFVMLLDNVETIDVLQYQAMKQLLYLMCVVFPNIVINNADFSVVNLPKHWGLSDIHQKDVTTLVINFYKQFRQFYAEKDDGQEDGGMDEIDESRNAINIFKRVMMLCKEPMKNVYGLLESLPFTGQTKDGRVFLFDNRFYVLFIKYLFTKAINLYIKSVVLVNERIVGFQKYEKSRIGVNDNGDIDDHRKYDAITEGEISDFMNQQISEEDAAYNDDITLLELMNDYLIAITPLAKYFNAATVTYEDIYRKVLASRENEKNTITRTLKEMSDEEREVQNLFKGHKLESWGKGLTKGLTRYVKENYDEEREAIEKRLDYERKMNNVDVATKMNMEVFMENDEYEAMLNEEVENEEYNMDHLGEDDDYGEDIDGDEFY